MIPLVSTNPFRVKRKKLFVKQILPYLIYSIRSGLGTVIGALLIVAAAYYGYLLQAEGISYDVRWIALLLIVPVLAWCPIRTYLVEPDLVFLLPAEERMKRGYFREAVRGAWLMQTAAAALIWIALFPVLDRHLPAFTLQTWAGTGAAIVLCKSALLYGSWQRRQWARNAHRIAERAAHPLLAASALAPLAFSFRPSMFFILSVTALYLALLRLPERFPLNWLRLLQDEQRARSRWMHFFSWFVDVETVSGRPERRRWLDRLIRTTAFRKENAYMYLYARVWLRSELWNMVLRLTLIGIVCIAVWNSIWLKAAALVFFCWVTGVQLQALFRHHEHSDWLHVYPLPEELRMRSIGRLIRRVHLASVIACGLALASTAWRFSWLAAAAAVLSWLLMGRAAERRAAMRD
jgi:ABC-2 type transport system permease protein